jgi:hypothetical protein
MRDKGRLTQILEIAASAAMIPVLMRRMPVVGPSLPVEPRERGVMISERPQVCE